MSTEKQSLVVPPRAYLFERAGFHSARITPLGEKFSLDGLSAVERASSADLPPAYTVSDEKASELSKYTSRGSEAISAASDDAIVVPTGGWLLKHKAGMFTLYESVPEGAEKTLEGAKALMQVDEEGELLCPSPLSTYTECGGTGRQAQMYKASGPGGDSWYSVNRTMKDFEGNTYKWKTACLTDDLTLLKSDGSVLAYFDRKMLSLRDTSGQGTGFSDSVTSAFWGMLGQVQTGPETTEAAVWWRLRRAVKGGDFDPDVVKAMLMPYACS
ncbi:hypothetical protein FRB99_000717 [Tulasnella sp. 403]|nr:hypothetical protein FRB99_000717 [Tulasnella sp. 403]